MPSSHICVLTALTANGTPGQTGNVWKQTDYLPRYSTRNFSVPSGWNRNFPSICAILFRPAAGAWVLEFFPPFPTSVGERCSRAVAVFSFHFLSHRSKQHLYLKTQNSFELSLIKFLPTKQQQTAAIATKSKLFQLVDKVSISSSKLSQSTGSATTSILLDFWFTRAM